MIRGSIGERHGSANSDPYQNVDGGPVLRIRDVYPGSQIRLFSIPDPNYLHPGSRIRIKEFKF
jgi:hypothetical protein